MLTRPLPRNNYKISQKGDNCRMFLRKMSMLPGYCRRTTLLPPVSLVKYGVSCALTTLKNNDFHDIDEVQPL